MVKIKCTLNAVPVNVRSDAIRLSRFLKWPMQKVVGHGPVAYLKPRPQIR